MDDKTVGAPATSLGRITLAARGDHRTVVTDNGAGMFGAVRSAALIAKEEAVIAKTTSASLVQDAAGSVNHR